MRSYLSVLDFDEAETRELLDSAAKLKAERKSGNLHPYLKNTHIALYFEKPSVKRKRKQREAERRRRKERRRALRARVRRR